MRKQTFFRLSAILSFLFLTIVSSAQSTVKLPPYTPPDKKLHDEIVRMDSIFFEAYNSCKMEVIDKLFSENIEFYHDQGGLSTSKKDLVNATRNNICGKVQRELIPGTIEVYPIPDFGAVQMGWHQFHNNQEPNAKPHPSKFMTIWKKENGNWVMSRIVSLH